MRSGVLLFCQLVFGSCYVVSACAKVISRVWPCMTFGTKADILNNASPLHMTTGEELHNAYLAFKAELKARGAEEDLDVPTSSASSASSSESGMLG